MCQERNSQADYGRKTIKINQIKYIISGNLDIMMSIRVRLVISFHEKSDIFQSMGNMMNEPDLPGNTYTKINSIFSKPQIHVIAGLKSGPTKFDCISAKT